MYLITRPQPYADELTRLLQQNDIAALSFPFLEIVPHMPDLTSILKRINACDGCLFVSPSAISLVAEHLKGLNSALQLVAIGKTSGQKLQNLTELQVIFPRQGSGVERLISEQTLLSGKIRSLAIIGGVEINSDLKLYLQTQGIKYDFIDIYQRVNSGLLKLSALEEVFKNYPIRGIVITSKLIADNLIACAAASAIIQEALNHIILISSHAQISRHLRENNFNLVCETSASNNLAILELIRNKL